MPAPSFRIHGYIGEGRNTSAVLAAFLEAHAGEAVDLIVNSPGGDALEGAAILAEIEAHGLVRCKVRGLAASSASLLICGASEITIHRAAYLMLHSPWTMTVGDSEAHREAAELLEKVGRTDAEVYSTSSGQPLARVEAWLAQELWLDADEAVALGFADAIEALGEGESPAKHDYSAHEAAPKALMQLALKNGWATASPQKTKESSDA